MKVQLGYVSIALKLPKVNTSSTVTYTNYCKLNTDEQKLDKLKKVTVSNVNDLYKILQYNVDNNIHFYRITSSLIPLNNHPEVKNWTFRKMFKRDFELIGKFVRENNMRIDTHPDQFNVLNSDKEEVVNNTIRNLQEHANLFSDMEYPNGKMILHVGGSSGGKEKAIGRFVTNFHKLPKDISEALILENDDKTFNTRDVLNICKELKIPMVLDVHHHLCNDGSEDLSLMLEEIFDTWKDESLPPKLHFSSPKEDSKDRRHADYIDAQAFAEFIEKCIPLNRDIDIMLETKQKDLALYKLVGDLRQIKPEWNFIDKSSFIIRVPSEN